METAENSEDWSFVDILKYSTQKIFFLTSIDLTFVPIIE